MKYKRLPWQVGLMLTVVVQAKPSLTQTIPDNTLGEETSRVIPINSQSDRLEGGAIRGKNLFHSFQEFSIPEGRAAYFANPEAIENIFSRVTGGKASLIMGKLGVLGNANLFLINPQGIIFGANASLDLRGSFVGSTAPGIIFPDGSRFSAINPQTAPLLRVDVVAPMGLQFEGDPSGTIYNQANLEVGKDLGLVGGEIVSTGQLLAQAGDIKIQATNNLILEGGVVGASGDVTLESGSILSLNDSIEKPLIAIAVKNLLLKGNEININALNNPGSELIAGTGIILNSPGPVLGNANFWSGGNFEVQDLGVLMSSGNLEIKSLGDVKFGLYRGGTLQILAGGEVEIETIRISNQAAIAQGGVPTEINESEALTLGISAGMQPEAIGTPKNAILANSFFTPFSNLPKPDTANITIQRILTIPFGGKGGEITLTNQEQPNTELMGDIIIGSEEGEDSFIQTGDYWGGGKLTIDSRNEISINNSVLNISSRDVNNEDIIQKNITSPKGPFFPSGPFLGNGGQIIFTSVDAITLSDSWLASNGLLGGNINLNSHNEIILQGLNKSGIISFTFGYNSDKKAENVSLSAPYLSFSNTHLFVDNYGDVMGGDLIINGEKLQIIDDSEISTDTYDRGRAGNLVINMKSIKISDSVIFASVNPSPPIDDFNPQQTMGKGANIIITTDELYLTKSAGIQLNNFASGEPSSITVLANDKIILEDFTGILSVTDNSKTDTIGNSGKVDLESKNGIFLNNSGITSYVDLDSRGNAGEIRINTNNLKLENGSLITTQNLGIGNAGQITINAQESFVIDGAGKTVDFSDEIESLKNFRSGVLSSIEEMAIGQGGDIDISTNSLQIMNQGQLNTRTNGMGNAGNINIQANSIGLTNGGLINAAAEANALGEGGNIKIRARNLTLESGSIISARSGQERGGNVEINLKGMLQLRNQSQISASAGTEQAGGDGGNILINTQFLVANPFENSDITANAFTGQGGNINISTQGIFGLEVREEDTPFSDITASSEFGVQGNITLDSLGIDPTRSLTILPQSLVTPELIQGCQKGEAKASFYDLGRGGIPTNPSDWFDAIPFPQENLIPLQPSPEKLKTPSSLHFSLPVMATRVIFTCTDP